MGDWLQDSDVADYLGAMTDPERITEATAASKQFCEDRRSDLGLDAMNAGEAPADVFLGAILYAALVYNARSSPTGYASFGDGSYDVPGDPTFSYARAMRLIGTRRPVAI